MRRIGIMGGTFNPIHIGHLTLAEWAREAAALDEVWFIPAGLPYMKNAEEVLDQRERFHMTELAVQNNAFFRCLDIELKREGYTYSYETLQQLKEMYPQDAFFFIAGADCLCSMEHWKCVEKLFSNCTVIAAVRDSVQLPELETKRRYLEQRFHGCIMLIPFMGLSVSSTEIRKRIEEGRSIRYLVPDNVLNYIEEKELYHE